MKRLLFLSLVLWHIGLWGQGITLGPDRAGCDSVLLDATLPNAAYLWSTGATSASIWATQSGTYWVEADSAGTLYRDTVVLTIVPTPALPASFGATVCGTGTLDLSVAGTIADRILWYQSPGSTAPLGAGSTFAAQVLGDTTFYVQALNTGPDTFRVGEPVWGGQGGFFTSVPRGVRFNVITPLTIEYVSVYANAPTTVTVSLRQQTTVLQNATFAVPGGQVKTPLACFFDVAPGNNYELVVSQISGGQLAIRSGVTFPYTVPGVITLTASSNNVNNNYYYLFDWQIRQGGCASPRVPYQVTVAPAPEVDLGRDTNVCGGVFVVDATFPNPQTQYLWSTNETSPTITLTASDTVSVLLSIGNCTVADTLVVNLADVPPDPVLTDTTICGPGAIQLVAQNVQGNKVLWYDDPVSLIPRALGDSVTFNVSDSTVFYAEVQNVFQDSLFAGRTTIGPSGSFFNNVPRGMDFNVLAPLTLESVSVYANQPNTVVEVSLFNAGGTLLNSVVETIPVANALHPVYLFFDIAPGNNYRLVASVISNGQLFVSTGTASFPYTLPGYLVLTRSSNNVNNNYYYLYDWRVQAEFCASNRVPVQVNVAPAPVLAFPDEQYVCGTSFVVDATQTPGNTTYLWQDGSQGATYTLTQTDTVAVQVTIGQCILADTSYVEIRSIPAAPLVQDTTFCNPGEYTLSTTIGADQAMWFGSPTGDDVLAVGNMVTLPFQDTTTVFIEAQNVFSQPNLIGPLPASLNQLGFFANPRGVRFDVLTDVTLDYVTLFAEVPTTTVIELRNAGGTLLDARLVEVPGGGLGHRIPLFMPLPVGNGHTLICTQIQGTLGIITNGVQFPYLLPDQVRLTGSSNNINDNYYYLFNWELRQAGCSSARVPLQVDIELPLNLPDYVYDCDTLLLGTPIPADMYLWNTGNTTSSLVVDTSGLYILQVQNTSGCIAIDTTEVEIPVNAGLPADGILCGNILTTNYDTTAIHTWSTGDTTATIVVTQPGVYAVSVLEPQGCFLTDTITITGFDDFPDLDLGVDQTSCDSLILTADPATTYLWSNGATSQSITVYSSGVYSVVIANINGCESRDTTGVFINPSPLADFFVPDTVFSPTLSVSFVNLSTFGAYTWSFGDGSQSGAISPTHVFADTGFYCAELIVTDNVNGCGSDTLERCFQLLRTLTSLEGEALASLRVYPNPTSGQLFIDMPPQWKGELRWQLFNPAGAACGQGHFAAGNPPASAPISLAGLPTGLYYLFLITDQGTSAHAVLLK